MPDDKTTSLIQKITSVTFDTHSDYPSACQVESATDGVMHFTYYEEDEEEGAFISATTRDGSFADVMSEAATYEVMFLEIGGLTDQEVLELVTAVEYRTPLLELASRSKLDDEMFRINGIHFAVDLYGALLASVLLPDAAT